MKSYSVQPVKRRLCSQIVRCMASFRQTQVQRIVSATYPWLEDNQLYFLGDLAHKIGKRTRPPSYHFQCRTVPSFAEFQKSHRNNTYEVPNSCSISITRLKLSVEELESLEGVQSPFRAAEIQAYWGLASSEAVCSHVGYRCGTCVCCDQTFLRDCLQSNMQQATSAGLQRARMSKGGGGGEKIGSLTTASKPISGERRGG